MQLQPQPWRASEPLSIEVRYVEKDHFVERSYPMRRVSILILGEPQKQRKVLYESSRAMMDEPVKHPHDERDRAYLVARASIKDTSKWAEHAAIEASARMEAWDEDGHLIWQSTHKGMFTDERETH